jgi:hypothetical protein
MHVHVSTDDVPPCNREQFWLDFLAKQVLRFTPGDRPDPETLRGQIDAHVTGRFTLYEWQTSHRIGRRTPAVVSRENSGKFHLRRVPHEQIYTAAPTRARPTEVRLGAGDFCVSSTGWPFESLMKDGTSASGLLIPHEVLSPLLAGGRLNCPVRVPAGSPLGSLLGAAFDAAIAQVPRLPPDLDDAILQNLCGLVALACGASEEGRWSGRVSLRAARLEAARRYIDEHLAEPGLTPTRRQPPWAYLCGTCICCSSRPAPALRNMSRAADCCSAELPSQTRPPARADRWPISLLDGASTASPHFTELSSGNSDYRRRRCARWSGAQQRGLIRCLLLLFARDEMPLCAE